MTWQLLATRVLLRLPARSPQSLLLRAVMLESIWQVSVHVPAVLSKPWRQIQPEPSRRLAMLPPFPVPVYERRRLSAAARFLTPGALLCKAGQAALSAVSLLTPMLHRWMTGGKLMESSGTTVGVVCSDRTGRNPIVVPWSEGERWRDVQERMVDARAMFTHPLTVASRKAFACGYGQMLPPPQVVISAVGHLGIQNPATSLFACGGSSPIAIVLGSESLSFVLDHRIYDAVDAAAFYEPFMEEFNA
jgi:hypothetical protein